MAKNLYGLVGVSNYMERRNNETLREEENKNINSISLEINPDFLDTRELSKVIERLYS